jgi:polyhydroxyalkanoate synthesis regulator phasin
MKTARESKKSMTDVLAELVSAGTLTQEQADAITEGTPGKGNMMARPAGEMKNPLSELVTAGTITQDELDAIQESMKTARESKKSMTDVLAELVSAGTLTQEQADAVSTAVKPARKQ